MHFVLGLSSESVGYTGMLTTTHYPVQFWVLLLEGVTDLFVSESKLVYLVGFGLEG